MADRLTSMMRTYAGAAPSLPFNHAWIIDGFRLRSSIRPRVGRMWSRSRLPVPSLVVGSKVCESNQLPIDRVPASGRGGLNRNRREARRNHTGWRTAIRVSARQVPIGCGVRYGRFRSGSIDLSGSSRRLMASGTEFRFELSVSVIPNAEPIRGQRWAARRQPASDPP